MTEEGKKTFDAALSSALSPGGNPLGDFLKDREKRLRADDLKRWRIIVQFRDDNQPDWRFDVKLPSEEMLYRYIRHIARDEGLTVDTKQPWGKIYYPPASIKGVRYYEVVENPSSDVELREVK
jgi:hypothetical protein